VLVNRYADSLASVDGEQGLLPFYFAADWGASLDLIFYLLQQCPNALCHGGSDVAAVAAAAIDVGPRSSTFSAGGTSGFEQGTVDTSSDDNKQQVQNDLDAHGPA
jgi:hypothetical protein